MRVLVVSTVGICYEGITSVILETLKAMDKSGLALYIVGTIRVEDDLRRTFEDLGCQIVEMPNRRTNTFRYFIELIKFIKEKKIDVVHAHGNSATLAIELLAAKIGGCKKRIAHSHNTKCDQKRADKLLRPLFYSLVTECLACSDVAGKWLYPKRTFKVINNGRNVEKYKYDIQQRNTMRNKYNLKDKLIIGHVGGFVEQKNHSFLIDIFKCIHSMNSKTMLVLVGDGVLRNMVEEKVKRLGIQDSVYFVGITNQVESWLQVMDGMLFPSLFEGLPLVTIEWQIAGLPCLLSDTITRECAVTDLVEFCSLNANPEKWASLILEKIALNDRKKASEEAENKIVTAGFDIKESSRELKEIYMR